MFPKNFWPTCRAAPSEPNHARALRVRADEGRVLEDAVMDKNQDLFETRWQGTEQHGCGSVEGRMKAQSQMMRGRRAAWWRRRRNLPPRRRTKCWPDDAGQNRHCSIGENKSSLRHRSSLTKCTQRVV